MALASNWLARELLHDPSLNVPFIVFAALFVLGLAATVIIACANGAKDFRTLAFINIGTAVSSLVLIAALSPPFGVLGGVMAMALLPLASWTIAWARSRRRDWWPRRPLAHGFSTREARGVVAFVPLAVISAVGLPLLQIVIRNSVAEHSGMADVGLLQGVVRLSDMYLGVATSVFAMYYFPRFSEIRDAAELVQEAKKGLAIIVPSVAVVSVLVYLLRDWIIRLVFTAEFAPMRDLFAWQMLGNTLKMVGWLFGYLLLAKANALAVAVLETATIAVWWLLSVSFISLHGTIGATEAYAVTYALYSIVTFVGVALVVRRMRAQPRAAVA
jgi:PST family polysaccharide transporter